MSISLLEGTDFEKLENICNLCGKDVQGVAFYKP